MSEPRCQPTSTAIASTIATQHRDHPDRQPDTESSDVSAAS
jgi:hypothetical protein